MIGYNCNPGNQLIYSGFIMTMLQDMQDMQDMQDVRRFHRERLRRRVEHDWPSRKEAGLN
jgi:hypothetical protein